MLVLLLLLLLLLLVLLLLLLLLVPRMQLDAPALSGAAMETEMEENRDGGGVRMQVSLRGVLGAGHTDREGRRGEPGAVTQVSGIKATPTSRKPHRNPF